MGENIFLFVPNIIGYARIVLAIASFYFMTRDYILATIFYVTSALLDAFDGYAARWLNQSTKFGHMLDQLVDRCSTMCLLVVLSCFYPKYMFFFQISMIIDIAGHWLYLHASLMQGKTSHKLVDLSGNPVMRFYYQSRPFLFFMCAGNEMFYSSLYFLYFFEGPVVPFFNLNLIPLMVIISAPIAFVKALFTLLHLFIASINLGIIDTNERKQSTEGAKTK